MRRLFLLIAVVSVGLLGIVYASSTNTATTTVIEQSPTEASVLEVKPTSESISLTYLDIAKTGRPQFLDAYGTWCPACQQNEPTIYALQRQFKGRVDFIYLNVDNPEFVEAASPYTLTGVTQYVLIDADGTIIQKWFGSVTEESVAESINAFLDGI